MNIGIVGGGNAACKIINHLENHKNINVKIVADISSNVPAVILARKMNIEVITDFNEILGDRRIDLIIELTGVPKIRQAVCENKGDFQDVMTSGGARVFCESLDYQHSSDEKKLGDFSQLVKEVAQKIENSNSLIKDSTKQMRHMVRTMRMITINAKIESSKLGQRGDSFTAIVHEIDNLANTVNLALQGIVKAQEDGEDARAKLSNNPYSKQIKRAS